MKRVVIFILLLVVCSIVKVEANGTMMLSDSAQIHLVTCEPGEEIYARFGHTGLRVYDPVNNIDIVAHWGLFSFDTPNFVGRFVSGNTDYQMGIFKTKHFLWEYINRGSSVYSQELNLTQEEKQILWEKLWENYEPENRTYRYNFIYDNCATRPYQLIMENYDKTVCTLDLGEVTYRDVINEAVKPWSLYNLGINLIIGSDADKNMSIEECVSFPLYTQLVMSHTEIEEDSTPIFSNNETLHKADDKEMDANRTPYDVFNIVAAILVLMCIVFYIRKKRYMPVLTQLILIISGLVGVVIAYLWFCSHHPLVDNNYNILWCNPLNLIFGILLFTKRTFIPKAKMIIAIALHLISILFLFVIMFDLQGINSSTPILWLMPAYALSSVAFTYKNQLRNSSHK